MIRIYDQLFCSLRKVKLISLPMKLFPLSFFLCFVLFHWQQGEPGERKGKNHISMIKGKKQFINSSLKNNIGRIYMEIESTKEW